MNAVLRLQIIRLCLLRLEEAEETLFNATRQFSVPSERHSLVHDQYEVVGDAATTMRHVLEEMEREAVEEMNHG